MARRGNFLQCIALAFAVGATAQGQALDAAAKLRDRGEFAAAAAALTRGLAETNLPAGERQEMARQIDLLQRVRHDYALTRAELFEGLSHAVRDLTRAEFDRWVAEDRFDRMQIDGEERFVDVSVSNLFFRYPELQSRRLDGKSSLAEQRARCNWPGRSRRPRARRVRLMCCHTAFAAR